MPGKKNQIREEKQNTDFKNFAIEPLDIAFGKVIILENTKLVIKYKEHYGIIGKNGIGKTSLLSAIADKTVAVPERLDIIYVKQEEPVSEKTVIETLLSSDEKIYELNKKLITVEEMASQEDASEEVIDEFNKLSQQIGSEYAKSKARAQKILYGLGFSNKDQERMVHEFSGGWRMRISLAKALFMVPSLLLLDEPTNHLDLEANIWLTEYLKNYPKTILVVSHDKYFIDEVCTTIIYINNKKLNYYVGNYDKFQKQIELDREKQQKDWEQFQKKIDSMKKTNKPQNEINEYTKKKSVPKPDKDYNVKINFLSPPVIKGQFISLIDITFGYENQPFIFRNLNLEINSTSRIAIVGKNGVGKSTLLKLINAEIKPISGGIIMSPNIRIGYYNQHFEESLPFDVSAVQYLMELNNEIDITTAHKFLSMFGLEPPYHKINIRQLSGGQKARVKLSSFGVIKPHLLMLDEPTNHLDIVAIASLINALNDFVGAIIVITHNFDVITSMNAELWLIENGDFYKYTDGYETYISSIMNFIENRE